VEEEKEQNAPGQDGKWDGEGRSTSMYYREVKIGASSGPGCVAHITSIFRAVAQRGPPTHVDVGSQHGNFASAGACGRESSLASLFLNVRRLRIASLFRGLDEGI